MIQPRDYQSRTVRELFWWLGKHDGNPCIVLPTGAGKSVVIAMICQEAISQWAETRILKLTARKELIVQNAEKLRAVWPGAPLGIYSAALNSRDLGTQIVFGGVQSLRGKAWLLGRIDLLLVDEAHEINHKDDGAYRELIAALLAQNPYMRVIGLTATPYRLGHGLITDKPALFDELIEPVTIRELQARGYLARLISKAPALHLDTSTVHMRGGDYIESELQAAVDTDLNNAGAVDETLRRAGDRRAWLFFCSGIDHAEHVRDFLVDRGIAAACVHGKLGDSERDRIIAEFRAGKYRAVTNANILTTGFDYQDIDLIAMLRPTCSPGLYIQMAGRGLRVKSHGGDCLVLDFAGNVAKHGPIVAVAPPEKPGEGGGVPPSKICPECDEIVPAQAKECPCCGYVFPKTEKKYALHDDDISGENMEVEHEIAGWSWQVQNSKKSGKPMLVVTYQPASMLENPTREYLCVWHDGYAGLKAQSTLAGILKNIGVYAMPDNVDELTEKPAPVKIKTIKDGKFERVVSREWAPVEEVDEIPF